MIDRIISFCINYLDVFDGLVIGILFTLGCQWAQRKLSTPKVNVTSVGAPVELKTTGSMEALRRTLERNKDAVNRSLGIPADKMQPGPRHTADDIEL